MRGSRIRTATSAVTDISRCRILWYSQSSTAPRFFPAGGIDVGVVKGIKKYPTCLLLNANLIAKSNHESLSLGNRHKCKCIAQWAATAVHKGHTSEIVFLYYYRMRCPSSVFARYLTKGDGSAVICSIQDFALLPAT